MSRTRHLSLVFGREQLPADLASFGNRLAICALSIHSCRRHSVAVLYPVKLERPQPCPDFLHACVENVVLPGPVLLRCNTSNAGGLASFAMRAILSDFNQSVNQKGSPKWHSHCKTS